MTASENMQAGETGPLDVPRPQPAAGAISTGLLLLIFGVIFTLANQGTATSLFGMLVATVGALGLVFGVHRVVRNLDSLAAAAYNRSLSKD